MKDFEFEHLPHYLSLGAGVQSSTLALMYATGELSPMPEAAIFADTQAEPASVYEWLDWLETQLSLIDKIGLQNYQQSQISPEED